LAKLNNILPVYSGGIFDSLLHFINIKYYYSSKLIVIPEFRNNDNHEFLQRYIYFQFSKEWVVMKMLFVRMSGCFTGLLALVVTVALLGGLLTAQLSPVVAGVIAAVFFFVAMVGLRKGMRGFARKLGVSDEEWNAQMGARGTLARVQRSRKFSNQVAGAVSGAIKPGRTCFTCGGSGRVSGGTCPECGGKGTVMM
jgi:hypothetical protein